MFRLPTLSIHANKDHNVTTMSSSINAKEWELKENNLSSNARWSELITHNLSQINANRLANYQCVQLTLSITMSTKDRCQHLNPVFEIQNKCQYQSFWSHHEWVCVCLGTNYESWKIKWRNKLEQTSQPSPTISDTNQHREKLVLIILTWYTTLKPKVWGIETAWRKLSSWLVMIIPIKEYQTTEHW